MLEKNNLEIKEKGSQQPNPPTPPTPPTPPADLKLEDVRKKTKEELTQPEKELLEKNVDKLTDDEKVKFGFVVKQPFTVVK